jgi:hypothetical protein
MVGAFACCNGVLGHMRHLQPPRADKRASAHPRVSSSLTAADSGTLRSTHAQFTYTVSAPPSNRLTPRSASAGARSRSPANPYRRAAGLHAARRRAKAAVSRAAASRRHAMTADGSVRMWFRSSEAYAGPANSRTPVRYRSGAAFAQNWSAGRTTIASVIARHEPIATKTPMRGSVSMPGSYMRKSEGAVSSA